MTRAYRENFKAIEWTPLPMPPRRKPADRRGDYPAPRIAGDVIDPVQSQATGKVYDSKSALRAEYRRLGMVEVGNDPARLRPRKRAPIDRSKIREDLAKAEARVKRGERANPALKDKEWKD